MNYYFYNVKNQKMKLMTKETFDDVFFLVDMKGHYVPVTKEDVTYILNGGESHFRVTDATNKSVLFTKEIIENYIHLPEQKPVIKKKANVTPEPVVKASVDEPIPVVEEKNEEQLVEPMIEKEPKPKKVKARKKKKVDDIVEESV